MISCNTANVLQFAAPLLFSPLFSYSSPLPSCFSGEVPGRCGSCYQSPNQLLHKNPGQTSHRCQIVSVPPMVYLLVKFIVIHLPCFLVPCSVLLTFCVSPSPDPDPAPAVFPRLPFLLFTLSVVSLVSVSLVLVFFSSMFVSLIVFVNVNCLFIFVFSFFVPCFPVHNYSLVLVIFCDVYYYLYLLAVFVLSPFASVIFCCPFYFFPSRF